MQHGQPGDENPLPPGLARHPHRGLVAAYYAGLAHRGRDRRCGRVQRGSGAGQDVAPRALAYRPAKHLAHQRPQPLQSDRVTVMQINHHGLNAAPERRAGFEARWSRCDAAHAAAGAAAAEQAYAGDVGADGRQFDAVVDVLRRLGLGGEVGPAAGAGVQVRVPRSDQGARPGRAPRQDGHGAMLSAYPSGRTGRASPPSTAGWRSCPASWAGGSIRRCGPRAPQSEPCRVQLIQQREDQRVLLGIGNHGKVD